MEKDDSFEQALELFDDLCDASEDTRAARLNAIADPNLRRQVEELLAGDARAGTRLEADALERILLASEQILGEGDTLPAEALLDGDLRYEEISEVGVGGMGRVTRVLDRKLGREVALKRIATRTGEPLVRARLARRFLREALLTGQLEHPGIVPVYDVGQSADGGLFFTMKLVEGDTLERVLCQERVAPRRLVRILQSVCDAVGFAHSNGVVHRDLKPSNIMVGRFGEVQVMDWGIAQRVGEFPTGEGGTPSDSGTRLTQDGESVGTPGYMAPEQRADVKDPVDERTDVYGLGAILYRALVGESARGEREERRAAVPVHDASGCRIPFELRAVCRKAMAPEKADRYDTLADLSADLEAAVMGQAGRAWNDGPVARLAKWVRAHPVAALSSGAAVLLVALAQAALDYRTTAIRGREEIAGIEQEEANRALRSRLFQLATQSVVSRMETRPEWPRMVREYLDAFAAFGLSFEASETDLDRVNRIEQLAGGYPETADVIASGLRDASFAVSEWRRWSDRGGLPPVDAALEARSSRLSSLAVLVTDTLPPLGEQRSLVERARGMIVEGSVREALLILEGAQEESPNSFWIQFLLARCNESHGDLDIALEHCINARSLLPAELPGPWIQYQAARLHQRLGLHRAALTAFLALLRDRPDSPTVLGAAVWAYVQMGEESAPEAWRILGSPDDPTTLEDADVAYLAGDLARRRGLDPHPYMARAVALDPTHPYAKARVSPGPDSYREGSARDPGWLTGNLILAQVAAKDGDEQVALDYLARVAAAEDNESALHVAVGWEYQKLGRLAEAEGQYDRAIHLDPKNTQAHLNRVAIHLRREEPNDAARVCQEVLAYDPDNVRALRQKGWALAECDRPEEAIAPLERSLALEPHGRTLHMLSHCYADTGRHEKARAILPEAIELQGALAASSEDPVDLAGLACLRSSAGEMELAFQLFAEVIDRESEYAPPYGRFARLLREQGRAAESVAVLEQYFEHFDRSSAKHLASLGRSYLHLGKLDEGIRHLEEASRATILSTESARDLERSAELAALLPEHRELWGASMPAEDPHERLWQIWAWGWMGRSADAAPLLRELLRGSSPTEREALVRAAGFWPWELSSVGIWIAARVEDPVLLLDCLEDALRSRREDWAAADSELEPSDHRVFAQRVISSELLADTVFAPPADAPWRQRAARLATELLVSKNMWSE